MLEKIPIYDPDDNRYLGSVYRDRYTGKVRTFSNYDKERKQRTIAKYKSILGLDSARKKMPSEYGWYKFNDSSWYTTGNIQISNNLYTTTVATTNNLVQSFQELQTTASTAAVSYKSLTVNLDFTAEAFAKWKVEFDKWSERETKRQAAAREAARIAREKHEAEQAPIIARARELLISHLSPEQVVQFETKGYFIVYGQLGNLYQIRTGRSHNVRQLDPVTMTPIRSLCAHPIEAVPDFDTMLAQKLWLEADEHTFVKMANLGTVYSGNFVIDELPQVTTVAIDPEVEAAMAEIIDNIALAA